MQELSLFQTPQVEVLNLQTFTTEYVANRYKVDEKTIRTHKNKHSDEIIENLHFIISRNDRNRPLILWTLRGIIKLGMFIRSKEAKNFRLWAEQELEHSILRELTHAKEAKERNLILVDKIANIEAIQSTERKHQNYVINGYKSQIAQHNAKINSLKNISAVLAQVRDERDFFKKEYLRTYEALGNMTDFDALNQVMQRGMHMILDDAKKKMYQLSTELTLKFNKMQRIRK